MTSSQAQIDTASATATTTEQRRFKHAGDNSTFTTPQDWRATVRRSL